MPDKLMRLRRSEAAHLLGGFNRYLPAGGEVPGRRPA
jgi:hypothetical protein